MRIGTGIWLGGAGGGSVPTVATPTFDIPAGAQATDISVTISDADSPDTIYYRITDPNLPATAWTVYSAPVAMVYPSGTLEAYAVKAGYTDSAIASAAYTFTMPADVADAIGRFDEPTGANVTLNATKIATWRNNGTAGASLDITEGTDGNRPTQSTTGGRYGAASAAFVQASSQRLRGGSAYAIAQPYTRMVRAKSSGAGGSNRSLMGTYGGAYTTGSLYYSTASQLSISAGTTLNNNTGSGTAQWGAWWGVYNGASSRVGREDDLRLRPPGAPVTGNAGTTVANGITVGAQGSGGLYHDGDIDRVLVWASAKSEAQLVKASEYWDGVAYRYIRCDGDSLTAGVAPATAFTDLLRTNYSSPQYQVSNYGVSGQTLADMASDFGTQFAPIVVSRRQNIYVMWGGRNDVSGGASSATILSRLYGLSAAAAAAGYTVIVVTITKSGTDTGGMETIRQAVNADVLAHYATNGIAYVYDAGAEANLQNTSDTTYFNADTKHLTTAGNQIIANGVQAAVTAL